MTKYSGRRYLREALDTVLLGPDETEAEAADAETAGNLRDN